MEKGQLHVQFNAGKLVYKKFNASNVSADVSIASNNYIINALHLNHAGGFINLNGNMLNTANHYTSNVNFAMKNMDVEKLFYAFDNFGQDGIMSSNLRGKLDINANAIVRIDSSGKISPGSVNSIVHFLLKEGRLINFEPIKKMQKFIFKNRNFDDISFADLDNTFLIRQKEVVINKMEIRSTVCTLFVEGVYSQEGKTDISIQVPLSNLNKKQDILPDYANKKKTGSSIFLRGRPGKDGKIDFKLDLFKKFQSKS